MKTKVYILYSCSAWHEAASRFFHGVFTTREDAVQGLGQMLDTAGLPSLSDDDFRNLRAFGQTQGYLGEGEFMIEEAPLDDIAVWL